MPGFFDGTSLQRQVTCERCGAAIATCQCPRDAAGQILLPADQIVKVRIEKRGKGKQVTLIEGLDPAATDLAELLKLLKSKCAAGGTLQGTTLEVQGDHQAPVIAALKAAGYRVRS